MGFSITYFIKCFHCKTSTQYSNEDLKVNFSYLVSGAALAGGINRNSFQTALTTIDITNQCSKPSYYNYQTRLYKSIIDDAKLSCEIILLEILDQLKIINLPDKEKILLINFDCSWSHSRNAHQAKYNYQPVIGFHIVEHSRSSKLINSDSSIILHNENFSGTSKQMEHAILFELLNNIMPILEETDFTLHICIDGDLETNRTLTYISVVSLIFVDLKHVRLVTTFRTSYNEVFNRKILKYLDKRIDYWASYCVRHALIIIDQNNGLDTMISKVYMVASSQSTHRKSKTQGTSAQEKIFEEIACELIKVLFVTPEKLVSNEEFCRFITKAWGQLRILKQHWESALIMLLTVTCT
ncbi:9524_t:CDS:2 [Diversispora eburnea]|uniref:9524_t:CDS:1 n=1 Tax=Diversispora eburnea TaxID=1213867 RepID=A0A9N9C5K2_9GLOM|nr:9524_t:CDS:2 [Diversispora eburnea]